MSVSVTQARSGNPARCIALFYRIFRHPPVGRPFSPGDRDQTRSGHQDKMIAGQLGGLLAAAFHKRSQPRKYASDILPRWNFLQIPPDLLQDEIDLPPEAPAARSSAG
jgi:hypothetical protein